MPLDGPDILLKEKRGRILYLTINRPERLNALSRELRQMLAVTWLDFAADDDLWVAVLTGAGDRAFCTGADLKEINELGPDKVLTKQIAPRQAAHPQPEAVSFAGILGLGYCPGALGVDLDLWKPVIAAINGFALAGGWRLAQACDLRIAAEHAELGISEVKRNLTAHWCCTLPQQIGLGNALEVVLLGERITAQRAYEMGFVNKIVPANKLLDAATEWAEIICENAPQAVRRHKEILYRGFNMSRHEAYAMAAHVVAPMATMEDTIEGPRAFVEKRKPIWKGR